MLALIGSGGLIVGTLDSLVQHHCLICLRRNYLGVLGIWEIDLVLMLLFESFINEFQHLFMFLLFEVLASIALFPIKVFLWLNLGTTFDKLFILERLAFLLGCLE